MWIESLLILILTIFFFWVLFKLFFFVFGIVVNLALIAFCIYAIRNDVAEKIYAYIIVVFLAIFLSLYAGSVWILWKPTVVIILTALAGKGITYILDKVK